VNKATESGNKTNPANKLTNQKNNSNSCWQLNLSPNTVISNKDAINNESQQQQQQRRNSIDKTIGDLTQKNLTTVIKDQNEIAIVTSVVPAKRNNNNNNNLNQNNETSSVSSTSSTSSLSRIRSLDSKSREKLKSNKDLKKSTANLTTSITSTSCSSSSNQPQTTLLPPSGSSKQQINKSENENRKKTSISNGVSLQINNNCFNSSSNPSFSTPAQKQADLSKKDVFERLSKRTNSMKNLAAGLKATRSTGSPSSSDRENDGKISPISSDEHVLSNHIDNNNSNQQNNNNSISKTSVFERLYKSNIAAHMNHQASLLNENQQQITSQTNVNNLKKNMSLSSANLVTNSNISTPNTNKKLNQNNIRQCSHNQKSTINKSTHKINSQHDANLKQDSENEESYRSFSNIKNYDGDDSNDDSNRTNSTTTTMKNSYVLNNNKNEESNQQTTQKFVSI